jgi:hypothetical protein
LATNFLDMTWTCSTVRLIANCTSLFAYLVSKSKLFGNMNITIPVYCVYCPSTFTYCGCLFHSTLRISLIKYKSMCCISLAIKKICPISKMSCVPHKLHRYSWEPPRTEVVHSHRLCQLHVWGIVRVNLEKAMHKVPKVQIQRNSKSKSMKLCWNNSNLLNQILE